MLSSLFLSGSCAIVLSAQPDTISTTDGPLKITPIKHASLMLEFKNKIIHVDPWSEGDYTGLPKADLILITDIHGDHMDPAKIKEVRKNNTVIVAPAAVAKTVTGAMVLNNGESKIVDGVPIEAVPMYNLVRGPRPGKLFHDKGRGNGYILTLGGKRLYLSGDTECIPEMKALKSIDIAFVCMNLPYTMPPEEAAECVKAFKPKIVYPYHYRGQGGFSDTQKFKTLVNQGNASMEVRLKDWYVGNK